MKLSHKAPFDRFLFLRNLLHFADTDFIKLAVPDPIAAKIYMDLHSEIKYHLQVWLVKREHLHLSKTTTFQTSEAQAEYLVFFLRLAEKNYSSLDAAFIRELAAEIEGNLDQRKMAKMSMMKPVTK